MTHDDYTAYLERVFTQWPSMRRYSATATLDTVTAIIDGEPVQRDCVTVTVFDALGERAEEQQEETNGAL